MFVGYNLESDDWVNYTYKAVGNDNLSNTKNEIRTNIEKYIDKDGNINATEMQEEWFPKLKKQIFLSHSSKDKELALTIAGFIEKELGISVFIDSCVWGFCDELLKKIDNKYCYNSSSKTYCYEKRNFSTSHVHNMLSTALMAMLDQCECVIFLNTDNSITKDDIFSKTSSPWIYNEIKMMELIRRNIPFRFRKKILMEKFVEHRALVDINNQFPEFVYDVSLDQLIKIDKNSLFQWKQETGINHINALDVLYEITNAIKRKAI